MLFASTKCVSLAPAVLPEGATGDTLAGMALNCPATAKEFEQCAVLEEQPHTPPPARELSPPGALFI